MTIFGPEVVFQNPGPNQPVNVDDAPVNHVDVFFSKPIDAGTFTADDVSITDPTGDPVGGISVTELPAVTTVIDEGFGAGLPAGSRLNGSAELVDAEIQLTSSGENRTAGSFFMAPVQLPEFGSLQVSFDFRFGFPGGGEGMTLTLLNGDDFDTGYLGAFGSGRARNLGYGDGPGGRSVAVELDTRDNPDGNDIDANAVGIDVNGDVESIAQVTSPFDLDDGLTHSMRVLVDAAGCLSVFVETGSGEVQLFNEVCTGVDLGSEVIIGFTASTGGSTNDHFVDNVQVDLLLPPGVGFGIDFDDQLDIGFYDLTIGPEIEDLVRGLTMDEAYMGRFGIGGPGPMILGQTPPDGAGLLAPFDGVDLQFDRPIDLTSLGAEDVVFTGPGEVPIEILSLDLVPVAPVMLFEDFLGVPPNLTLHGSAFIGGGELVLTEDDSRVAGSAFFDPLFDAPTDTFSVEFEFRMEGFFEGEGEGEGFSGGNGIVLSVMDARTDPDPGVFPAGILSERSSRTPSHDMVSK